MATTYTHANFSIVDENHEVNVIYPQNTGIDVSIDRSQNATIPSDVSNAQQLANRLAATAFATNIDDNNISTDTTLSSNKIDSELGQLSDDLRGGYDGTMQDLANNSNNSSSGVIINDSMTDTATTWSSSKISSEISTDISDYNNTLRGGYSGTLKNLYDAITARSSLLVDPISPRCILTVNKENVSSDYGYTLNILHEILQGPDWSEYIKDGDYINLITKNNDEFQMIFNIDTYYDPYGDLDNHANGFGGITTHHIDMISRHLIPNVTWSMMYSGGNNNGDGISYTPYLKTIVKSQLVSYYNSNIPDILKPYIIPKRAIVPRRYYTSSSPVTANNGTILNTLPELWIPFHREIFGTVSGNCEGQLMSYKNITTVKNNKNSNGSAANWWTASPSNGNSTSFIVITSTGGTANAKGDANKYSVPLCFRFV